MSVEIASLYATLEGRDAGFGAMMTRADSLMNSVTGHATSAVGVISKLTLGLAGLAVGGLAASVRAASDFQQQLVRTQNNTTMTTADVGIMRQAILQMASQSNVSFDQLSTGFMHITNLGFGARDAVQILQQAMMSASSTGGDTASTAQMLANVMHEFGASAGQAAQYMDVLHMAAAQGNSTLEQFVDSSGKAMAMAANIGVPLNDVSAALSALTRHGIDSAQASTLVQGALSKIVNPAKATQKELAYLSSTSGIDLVGDFTQAGLASKGLMGVLNDVALATKGNTTQMLQLIPATRGGLAAMILTGTGASDYRQILQSLNDTMAGRLHPTLDSYRRMQQTTAFQMGVLKNNVDILGITIGSVLLPPLVALVSHLVTVVQAFVNWLQHTSAVTLALSAVKTFITTQFIPAVRAIAQWIGNVIRAIKTWLDQHPAVVAMLKEIATSFLLFAANSLAGKALVWVFGMITDLFFMINPLGALIAIFATAWEMNWGHIQEKLQAVWKIIGPILGALGHLLDTLDPGAGAAVDLVALGAALAGVAVALRAIEAAQGAIAVLKGLAGILGLGGGGGAKDGGISAGADKDIAALNKSITTYFPPLTTAITLHVRNLTTAVALHFGNLRAAINTHVSDLVDAINKHVYDLVSALTAIAPKMDGLKTAVTTYMQRLSAAFTAIAPKIDALKDAINTHFGPLTDAIRNMPHTIALTGGGGGGGTGTGGTTPTSVTVTIPGAAALTTALGTLTTTLGTLNTTITALNTTITNRLIPALNALSDTIKKIPTTITITGASGATIPVTVDLQKAIQDAVNKLRASPVDITPGLYMNWATLKGYLQGAITKLHTAPVDLTAALYLNAATLRADLAAAIAAIKPPVDISTALIISGLRGLFQMAVSSVKPPVDITAALVISRLGALLLNAVTAIKPAIDLTPALSLAGLPAAIRRVLAAETFQARMIPNGLTTAIRALLAQPNNIFSAEVRPHGLADAITDALKRGVQFAWGNKQFSQAMDTFNDSLKNVIAAAVANGFAEGLDLTAKTFKSVADALKKIGVDVGGGGGTKPPPKNSGNAYSYNIGPAGNSGPTVFVATINLDGKQLATAVFNVASADRRMRPEMVSA